MARAGFPRCGRTKNGRFASCDAESPAPSRVRRQTEAEQRAAARRGELERRGLTSKICFRTKAAMLKAFKEANLHVTQRCQRDPTGAEFDPVNHKYDRAGKRIATSCDDAIRIAAPTRRPYCVDRIDLEVLNRLDVADQHGGFRLPPAAQSALTERQARERPDEEPEYGAPGRPEPRPHELEGLKRRRKKGRR